MKNKNAVLDKVILPALILAAAAWLGACVAVGIQSKSVLYIVLAVLACGVYVFGLIQYFGMDSYTASVNDRRYLYYFLMIAGLLLAGWVFSEIKLIEAFAILLFIQLLPLVVIRQIQINDGKKLDGYMSSTSQTRADQVARATQATNMREYAQALGLNYIPAQPVGQRQKISSQFVGHLNCQYCSAQVSPSEWPVNGDAAAFFFQKTPGRYNLKLTCPSCNKDSYVVWDQDPGTFLPLL